LARAQLALSTEMRPRTKMRKTDGLLAELDGESGRPPRSGPRKGSSSYLACVGGEIAVERHAPDPPGSPIGCRWAVRPAADRRRLAHNAACESPRVTGIPLVPRPGKMSNPQGSPRLLALLDVEVCVPENGHVKASLRAPWPEPDDQRKVRFSTYSRSRRRTSR
jgi:hypothetical protein